MLRGGFSRSERQDGRGGTEIRGSQAKTLIGGVPLPAVA